ncbi:MAG: DrmE family protein [Oscillospiraceae bacterium]|nr:DrmE family protein [Oscillospiraceae bacterium]
MTNEQAFLRLTEKCDIYFEESLISKERLIQKYVEFFSSAFDKQEYSLSVAQHTGSICFDVVSFLIAALGCLALNETENDDIIRGFEDGEIVLMSLNRSKERRIWRGFYTPNKDRGFDVSDFDNAKFAMLEQPEQHSKHYIPRKDWYRISPYKGTSTRTDGRGIKRQKSNRNEFISFLFDIPVASIPSVVGVSTVIVSDRELFGRIANGVRVEYGNGNSVGLLDLVAASYYTSNLEEHRFGANPAKIEPSLKITSRISAARELVLDKSGNKTVGFMIVSTDSVSSHDSELTELLERKSLKFSLLTSSVDSGVAQEVIKAKDEASIFVCTKEFLLHHSEPLKEANPLTVELDSQVEHIVNNEISPILVDGIATWQEIKALKNALFAIKRSDIKSENKDDFIVTAHALTNLILTAAFPLERLNKAFEQGGFATRATSPIVKLDELWRLAEKSTELVDCFLDATDAIDRLYYSILMNCPKHNALVGLLEKYADKRTAVIVPKGYYADILKEDAALRKNSITVVTANRFDGKEQYDVIIVVGDFMGTHFNPFKCRSASDILVLLYDGEAKFFAHKKRQAEAYEKSINDRLGIEAEDDFGETPDDESDFEDIVSVASADGELETYIDKITSFNVDSFVKSISGYSGNAPATDIYAVGSFISGEQILFTRYYQAVVFDESSGSVSEKDVDSLRSGDTLVFAKRDDNTKNMVDYIFEQLQQTDRLSNAVVDATEKSLYWKLALREYRENHNLSFREVAKRLQGLGLSIQEVSVRQWLIDESRIIGPREENTLMQIANLTQDPFLLDDVRGYFDACEVVRKQRKNILKLIGKAITDKLSGFAPTGDKLLEFIFENVEKLSETVELDDISGLDRLISVPTTFTNRPIKDMEVGL